MALAHDDRSRVLPATKSPAPRLWRRSCRKSDGGDDGVTLVEVVMAIAFTGMAIAASAAAISAASNSRSATVERSLAAEIANEVIQEAEAFGCGLPDPYLGVTAAQRATRCTFDDRTVDGYSFDVDLTTQMHCDPVVLARTVTVTSMRNSSRVVEITSLQAVLAHLAAPGWTCS